MQARLRAAARKMRVGRSPDEHARHVWHVVYPRTKMRLQALLADKPMREWRVLDLGCGYHYPLVALLSMEVGHVEGVDIDPVFFRDGWVTTFRCRAASSGVLRGLKWAGPRRRFYKRYYRVLSELSGRRIDHPALSLSHYDGARLPYPDACFDAVYSHVVLEHVQDLPRFVSETARVLRPDGAIDMVWHNFFSPTGGHRTAEQVSKSPWGHLTGAFAPAADLNRKRPEEMAGVFSETLRVIRLAPLDGEYRLSEDPGYRPDAGDLLSDEWRARLAEYPTELLTSTCYLLQARKPLQPAAREHSSVTVPTFRCT